MTDTTDNDFEDDPGGAWTDTDFFEQKLEALTAKVDDLHASTRDAASAARRAEAQRLADDLDAVKNVLVAQLAELRDELAALE